MSVTYLCGAILGSPLRLRELALDGPATIDGGRVGHGSVLLWDVWLLTRHGRGKKGGGAGSTGAGRAEAGSRRSRGLTGLSVVNRQAVLRVLGVHNGLGRSRHRALDGGRVGVAAPQVRVDVSFVAAGDRAQGVRGRRDGAVGEAMSRSSGAVLVGLRGGTTSVGLGRDVAGTVVQDLKLLLDASVN